MINSLIIFHFKQQCGLKLEIDPHDIPLISLINRRPEIALLSTVLYNFILSILNIYYQRLFAEIFFVCISWLPHQFSAIVILYVEVVVNLILLFRLIFLKIFLFSVLTLNIFLLSDFFFYLDWVFDWNLIACLLLFLIIDCGFFILCDWWIFGIKIKFERFVQKIKIVILIELIILLVELFV